MSTEPQPWARRIIASQIEETEYMSVCEMIADDAEQCGMSVEQTDQAARDIHDLIVRTAVVTVIFPGDPVCSECGGTGQPDSESDGTPKDLPQYEAVLDATDTWLDNEDDSDGLATTIMGLLGAAKAESEDAK